MAVVAQDHANDEHAHDDAHGHEVPYALSLKMNRLGLWLFCFSELFLFGGLLVARFVLWGNTRPALDQNLGLITTSVLLVSSIFMAMAESAMAHNDLKTFNRSMLATFVLGTAFLLGVVGLEWGGHIAPTDGAYGAVFYGMTGIHAFHVFSGLILILLVWNKGRKGQFTAEKHWGVEACAIYWHFIDVVWVFFYPAIYLIGHGVHL